jgi:hypothetical protein
MIIGYFIDRWSYLINNNSSYFYFGLYAYDYSMNHLTGSLVYTCTSTYLLRCEINKISGIFTILYGTLSYMCMTYIWFKCIFLLRKTLSIPVYLFKMISISTLYSINTCLCWMIG